MVARHLVLLWLLVGTSLGNGFESRGRAESLPNILWITAEDMSASLGCYGDAYATTPNLDRFSRQSVRYSHAFATSPVCSPVRSCLITGCYAPSLGTHAMRSGYSFPESIRGFPSFLRRRGYYTSNNVKTDYNTSSWKRLIKESWDESSNQAHWRKRKPSQPFFSVFNLMTSHQSRTMVWSFERFVKEIQGELKAEEIHDPAKAVLPLYYPDTPRVRRTVGRYYDCVTLMDRQVGALLQQLEDDGLSKNTIVFFFSDHGAGMPRHKRALLDSGMHVPLMIRFPKRFQNWAPTQPGAVTGRMVSFVDFPSTVLSLAGSKIPAYMQGVPFLGPKMGNPRRRVYGHRDRVDEVFDVARSVRDQRYLYIRNYMPHYGYNQFSAWPDQGEIRHEFYRLANANKMTPEQWQFVRPTRAVEELYDTQSDQQNVQNLATDPKHRDILTRLRKENTRHLSRVNDLGFLSEIQAARMLKGRAPWTFARGEGGAAYTISREAANMVGNADQAELMRKTQDKNEVFRYWAVVGLKVRFAAAKENAVHGTRLARSILATRLKDPSPAVRIAASGLIARMGDDGTALRGLTEMINHTDLNVVLAAMREIEMLGDLARSVREPVKMLATRMKKIVPPATGATFVQTARQDLAMFTLFSANGFLNRVVEKAQSGD